MASPVVAATNGGNSGGAVQNHTINLPTGIASGHLLVAIVTFDAVSGTITPTWPAGWTQIYHHEMLGGSFDTIQAARYRVADGSEGASITVTTTPFVASAHNTYRITGHDSGTSPPEIGTWVDDNTGVNLSPDPPNLAPTGGSRDYLWIAVCGYTRNRTTDAYPTNYTGGFYNLNTVANIAGVASATRALTASSDNPTAFTLSANTGWIANTMAIYPTGGGGAVPSRTLIGVGT